MEVFKEFVTNLAYKTNVSIVVTPTVVVDGIVYGCVVRGIPASNVQEAIDKFIEDTKATMDDTVYILDFEEVAFKTYYNYKVRYFMKKENHYYVN